MRLFEHPDFRDALIATQAHFANLGLSEQFIEKDYYVTEALRIVATQWPTQVIFKGGTSLSKGWKLIQRFSEDIDLFLNRDAFSPRLSNQGVDKELKAIQDLVDSYPGLTLLSNEGRWKRGVNRSSYFSYTPQFSGNQVVANRILLEMGTRSGTYPTQTMELSSYIAEFLHEIGESLEAEDESSFSMQLLDFRRTFIEKLFAIHSKVMLYQSQQAPIEKYARHYYDLYCLAQQPEVQEMLKSEQYSQLKQDCARISQQHFEDYYPPQDMTFSKSEALFPTGVLRQTISKEYEQQCQALCYGQYPTWEEVALCFEELRNLL
ncbi:MAG TPA: nucleotidyl transferase AbiEii/AbiGii toxin family protein [Cyanophyceae cyanobacterium]